MGEWFKQMFTFLFSWWDSIKVDNWGNNWLIGLVGRVFAIRLDDQVESYQRLKKWYLIPPCLTLSIISYVSRVKWSNPGKEVAPSPTPQCSSYWKGSLQVTLDYCCQLYYLQLIEVITFCCYSKKKDDMIPFPFNENQFSFFVADHLLVGQLCTNPKSNRSLLSCLKVTQCSTSEIGDAPLYNHALYRSKLWQQDHCQHSQNENPDGSTLEGRAQGDENKVSDYGYCLWCGFKWGPHHATSHLRNWLESQHQSLPGCAEECGDLLVQSGGRWQTLGVAAGLGAGPQVQRDPSLVSEGVLRLCTLLSLAPPPLPTWIRWTMSYVENITNMTSHNTKASLIAAICRAPAGACGKECSQFRIRIKAVIEAEGSYIE